MTKRSLSSMTLPCGRVAALGPLTMALSLILAAGLAAPVRADPGALDGSWSGGGSVSYPSGAQERAKCKASYKHQSGTTYSVNAVCASASGKVSQTATIQRTGDNAYSGSFVNKEYGVDGSIHVQLQGSNSQSVTLIGGGGTANFRLSR